MWFESVFVPNTCSVASARRDERELCEYRPVGETRFFDYDFKLIYYTCQMYTHQRELIPLI